MQQLYQKTGNVDVATIMPRKIDIETIHDTQIMQQHKQENISQEEQSQNSNVPKPWGSISNNKFEGDPFS